MHLEISSVDMLGLDPALSSCLPIAGVHSLTVAFVVLGIGLSVLQGRTIRVNEAQPSGESPTASAFSGHSVCIAARSSSGVFYGLQLCPVVHLAA
jgi:hypothetical protein